MHSQIFQIQNAIVLLYMKSYEYDEINKYSSFPVELRQVTTTKQPTLYFCNYYL